MPRTRAVFCEITAGEAERISHALPRLSCSFFPETVDQIPPAELAGAEILSVFVHSSIPASLLARLPSLRMIATRSTGFDQIDLGACNDRGIVVSNVPHYGENTVAEFTFALLLSLTRRIPAAVERTRTCDFRIVGLRGIDLRGKTLGVVGAGNIGLQVIRIARGFGMSVLAFDVRPHPLLAEVLGFRYAGLGELLAASDVVSLHIPGGPKTHHLMNRERFAQMKRGAILINTARGSVVDSDALLWALDQQQVAAAGLDVIEGEAMIQEDCELRNRPYSAEQLREVQSAQNLLRHPNVLVTPHVAFDTAEAEQRILDTTIENIRAFLAGTPINVVNQPAAGGARSRPASARTVRG